jgi:hypothetical protein
VNRAVLAGARHLCEGWRHREGRYADERARQPATLEEAAGFFEIWFMVVLDPGGERAWWLRYTLFTPAPVRP